MFVRVARRDELLSGGIRGGVRGLGGLLTHLQFSLQLRLIGVVLLLVGLCEGLDRPDLVLLVTVTTVLVMLHHLVIDWWVVVIAIRYDIGVVP